MTNIEGIVNKMLGTLQSLRNITPGSNQSSKIIFTPDKIIPILKACVGILRQEDTLLQIDAPLKIVGDIQGQFFDLLRLFQYGGHPSQTKYLFLGNYANGGQQGVQVLLFLYCLKIKYPSNIFLLRGNNQTKIMCNYYGFFHQCILHYNESIYKAFVESFNYLPIAAVVSNSIFCVHGGLAPKIKKIEEIQYIKRPIDIFEGDPLCDLLWSDPSEAIFQWSFNKKRMAGCCFGIDAVQDFLQNNKLDLICRSHEMMQDGYLLSFKSKLLTIFSAPNYLNYFKNSASMLWVTEDLLCTIMSLKPRPKLKTSCLKSKKRIQDKTSQKMSQQPSEKTTV